MKKAEILMITGAAYTSLLVSASKRVCVVFPRSIYAMK
jgi:hypothetical protein